MNWLIYFYIWLCFSVPALVAFAGPFIVESTILKILFLTLAPIVYIVSTVLTCGLLAQTGKAGLVEGKFNRTISDPMYFRRRLHATPWTYIFYFKPLYFICLSIAPLKSLLFRLFGYKGQLDFVAYPDTWLRDLPVLDIGAGAYLSNKSSIATNICLMDGRILVEGIKIGKKSCVGHATLIGPGTTMGEEVEIDASTTSGLRVNFGNKVKIGEMCGIQHGVKIEDGAVIEATCVIGLRCRIGPNIRIIEGSHLHTGTRIKTQTEADLYFSEETGALSKARKMTLTRIASGIKAFDPSHLEADEGPGRAK